ncbi:MAG: hypothetical protein ACPLW5_02150, partial [Candidatus Bathyarchaeales archaeon]
MKGLAEFFTVLGMFSGLKIVKRFNLSASFSLGITARVSIMMLTNLALIYTGVMPIPFSFREIPLNFVLLTGIFNTIQGTISIVGGFLIYAAIKRRLTDFQPSVL